MQLQPTAPEKEWFNSKEDALWRMAEAQEGDEWMELDYIREVLVPYQKHGTVNAAIKNIKDLGLVEPHPSKARHAYRVTPLGFKAYEALQEDKRIAEVVKPPKPTEEEKPDPLPGIPYADLAKYDPELINKLLEHRELLKALQEEGYKIYDPTGRTPANLQAFLARYHNLPAGDLLNTGKNYNTLLLALGFSPKDLLGVDAKKLLEEDD